MVAIDYLMTIPGCDWLINNQSIAGALVERLACRTHWLSHITCQYQHYVNPGGALLKHLYLQF